MNGPPNIKRAPIAAGAPKINASSPADISEITEPRNFLQLGCVATDVFSAICLPLSDVEETYIDTPPAVLNQAVWAHLHDLGISGRSLNGCGPYGALGLDSVEFLPGNRFEFCRFCGFSSPTTAIIIPVFDESGDLVDLCAWSHRENRYALWRGAVSALGLQNSLAPRLDGPLVIHQTVLSWLRSGREGLFVIDHKLAAQRLFGMTLRVEDPQFGRALIDQMTLAPRVVIERRRAA